MPTFFHGWRRKAGIVTLLMALALMGMCARSFCLDDDIEVPQHLIFSNRGRVLWARSQYWSRATQFKWRAAPVSKRFDWLFDCDQPEVEKEWNFNAAGLAVGNMKQGAIAVSIWTIPYWSLVTPLTLLSAYLIHWKPRKQPTTASQTHA